MTQDELRDFYARYVTAVAGVTQASIVEAFGSVKREAFVGPGPWQVPVNGAYIWTASDDPSVLYQNILVALDSARGINNGEPSLHAKCIGEADPRPGDIVIHVGTGTGYYTAILAHLVAPGGRVVGFEVDAELARRTADNLVSYPHVTVQARSGADTQLPSADVIYVSAGATHIPAGWLDALRPGGRLVLPLTPEGRPGCMLRVVRTSGSAYAARIFSAAVFIPCVGARDEEESRAIASALERRSINDVRSLRRGDADESAWCVGRGWWLSTQEP